MRSNQKIMSTGTGNGHGKAPVVKRKVISTRVPFQVFWRDVAMLGKALSSNHRMVGSNEVAFGSTGLGHFCSPREKLFLCSGHKGGTAAAADDDKFR